MSEHITHIAVYEDLVKIVEYSENKFPKAFIEAFNGAYDSGLVFSASRGNHLYAIPILKRVRDIYGTEKFKQEDKEQLAAALGWLSHRAIDLEMKPMFKKIPELENQMLIEDECQMYHDATVFREVYKKGEIGTKSPYHTVDKSLLSHRMQANPASRSMEIDIVENWMSHYYVEQFLKQCMFIHTENDINVFTEKIVEGSLDLYEDLRMYIRAFENPEPFKQTAYINNFNIYDERDPILQYVRYAKEFDKPHPSINLEVALEQAALQSHYSRGLKKSYDFLLAAADFFNKKISENEVIRKCEI